MKHLTRVAAVAATSALAAAGLVGTATTSAQAGSAARAATVDTNYSCTTAFGDFSLPVSLTSNLPTKAKAGKKIGATNVGITITVPGSLAGAAAGLFSATEMGGTLSGNMLAGKTPIPLTGTTEMTPFGEDPSADLVISGTGKTAAFKIKKAGKYIVSAPKALNFIPLKDGGAELSPGFVVPCTLTAGAPSKLGTIKVTK